MSAYLTSVNLLPEHQTRDETSLCSVDTAPLISDEIASGIYALNWDFSTDQLTKELFISFSFSSESEPANTHSLLCPALPYFSNEVLREKVKGGLGSDPEHPKSTYRHAVLALREHFDSPSPLEMVNQLRNIQEWEFLEAMRQQVDFLPASDTDQTFRALHQAISTALLNPDLKYYVTDRPLVIHAGMEDHLYFRDILSLNTDYEHVYPIDLENFGPDDSSTVNYD